ncbi:hypothetical protein PI125_g9438 [Phytophthora idaei]|nr:hypothetical protein PI125_g9438 [Phytophthora idaei]KAG3156415.1 hypothetical protein PI126_g8759 [Phytophthora idaei]
MRLVMDGEVTTVTTGEMLTIVVSETNMGLTPEEMSDGDVATDDSE